MILLSALLAYGAAAIATGKSVRDQISSARDSLGGDMLAAYVALIAGALWPATLTIRFILNRKGARS